MNTISKLLTFLFLSLTINLYAGENTAVENFTLKDYNGKEVSLSDFKDSEAVVVMFIATRCPVSNAYNERMAKIFESYRDKNIAFLGINSNKTEDALEVKEHAEQNGLDFTILKDPGNKIADKFGATVTPEIYVLNKNLEILYHGRIDDSQREGNVKDKDLSRSLEEILAGKEVSVTKTKAFGCSIKRVE